MTKNTKKFPPTIFLGRFVGIPPHRQNSGDPPKKFPPQWGGGKENLGVLGRVGLVRETYREWKQALLDVLGSLLRWYGPKSAPEPPTIHYDNYDNYPKKSFKIVGAPVKNS